MPALLAGSQCLASEVFPGNIVADHQNATNPGRLAVVVDRAIAVGPPYILPPPMPGDGHELVLVPGGSTARHDELDLRADDVPDLGPAFTARLPERTWMALRAHRLAIGI